MERNNLKVINCETVTYKVRWLKWNEVIIAQDEVLVSTLKYWAQLFKTNNVVSQHIIKTLIIKYGIYTSIFAEKKMWVAFAFAKATHIFSAKLPVN